VLILGGDDAVRKTWIPEARSARGAPWDGGGAGADGSGAGWAGSGATRDGSGAPPRYSHGLVVAAEVLSREIDGDAQRSDVDAESSQDLACPTLDVEDPDQKVLRVDMGVASLKRQPGRSVDGTSGPWRKRGLAEFSGATPADGLGDLCLAGIGRRARRDEGKVRISLYSDEPEQEVLRADVRVIELSDLLVGHLYDPTGALAEAFHGLHDTA
jgi:hypothetical protein